MSNIETIKYLLETQCIKGNDFLEYLDIDKAKMLTNALSSEINNLCFHKENLANEIANTFIGKRVFAEVCENWIQILNYQNKHNLFDARNEYATKFGRDIINNSIIKERNVEDILSDKDGGIVEYIIYYFFNEHRQIQQDFSDLVVFYLKNYGRESLRIDAKELLENY